MNYKTTNMAKIKNLKTASVSEDMKQVILHLLYKVRESVAFQGTTLYFTDRKMKSRVFEPQQMAVEHTPRSLHGAPQAGALTDLQGGRHSPSSLVSPSHCSSLL